jgi:hypothetical protein
MERARFNLADASDRRDRPNLLIIWAQDLFISDESAAQLAGVAAADGLQPAQTFRLSCWSAKVLSRRARARIMRISFC